MKRLLIIAAVLMASCSPYLPVGTVVPPPASHGDGFGWQGMVFNGSGFEASDHTMGIGAIFDRTFRNRYFRFAAYTYLYGGPYRSDGSYYYAGGFEETEVELILPIKRFEVFGGLGLGSGLEFGSYVSSLYTREDSTIWTLTLHMFAMGGLAYNFDDYTAGIRFSYGFPTGISAFMRHSSGWFGQLGFDYTTFDFLLEETIWYLNVGRMFR